LALQVGLPGLHIVSMLTAFPADSRPELFDAFAEFEPAYTQVQRRPFFWRKREKFYRKFRKWSLRLFGRASGPPQSYDYGSVWRAIVAREPRPRVYPGAFVDWDNTPRRGLERGIVMRNFDSGIFSTCFPAQLRKAARAESEFLFINAWNEWAEGAYLEPDEVHGTFFLETIRGAVASLSDRRARDIRL
jgi:hypothetical protein